MERAQLIKAFIATVQASLHGLRSIEPVLCKEQAALTGKDPAILEQVVAEKLELLKHLNTACRHVIACNRPLVTPPASTTAALWSSHWTSRN